MKIFPLLFLFFVTRPSIAQVDSRFKSVLLAVFQDERISSIVRDPDFGQGDAIFLYANREFLFQATSRGTQAIDLTGWQSGRVEIFKTEKNTVFMFESAMVLGAKSDNKIRNVVVLDSFKDKGQSVAISFHTIDLNSKFYHKINKSGKIFNQITCQLTNNGGTLSIGKVVIKVFHQNQFWMSNKHTWPFGLWRKA